MSQTPPPSSRKSVRAMRERIIPDLDPSAFFAIEAPIFITSGLPRSRITAAHKMRDGFRDDIGCRLEINEATR